MKTLVLGCGPAGLLAALAIKIKTGKTPLIISKYRRSEMFGTQYLHKEIPYLTSTAGTEPINIKYDLWGSSDDYRTKVYGAGARYVVSPETFPDAHPAWDIRLAYTELWNMFERNIVDMDLSLYEVNGLSSIVAPYDLVVNTVPRPTLCWQGHTFAAQEVLAVGDAPERGVRCPVRVEHNTVVCNGEPEPAWYRASNVFGYASVEYPANSHPPFPGLSLVRKPLDHNCDCWPNWMHVGRFGAWKKGVLSHEAYFDVAGALS